jgi:beta-lactamase regulating signal transducer with metallopeptidase domain
MFAIRGVALSISVFVIVSCGMSLAVMCTWQRFDRRLEHLPAQRLANLLFALRIFPLLLALLITAAFAIPSFLLLEPRSIIEPLGDVPLALALIGSFLVLYGFSNAVSAMRRASRTVAAWEHSAEAVATDLPFPVLRMRPRVPALTAAGILRPRILLSGSAEFVLNGNELRNALNHELAHIRRRDNLKKLLLRFVAFPGMHKLDAAWVEISEMAADDAAVSSTADALDLAAALIKLSNIKGSEPSPDLTAALVHGNTKSINTRVERLISWSEQPHSSADFDRKTILAFVVSAAAVLVITYGSLLMDVHKATEWLVR